MPYKDIQKRKEYAKRYYIEHKNKICARARKWLLDNKNKESVEERNRKQAKRYYQNHKESVCKKQLKRYYDNPKQSNARHKVFCEKRKGNLIPETYCEMCGKKRKTEAHHPDYGKPLEVKWLCHQCHQTLHLGKEVDVLSVLSVINLPEYI